MRLPFLGGADREPPCRVVRSSMACRQALLSFCDIAAVNVNYAGIIRRELRGCKSPYSRHRKAMVAGPAAPDQQCCVALGAPRGLQQLRVNNRPLSSLYQRLRCGTNLASLPAPLRAKFGHPAVVD